MNKEYKITAPEGFEAVEQEENGVINVTFKPIEKEVDLQSLMDKITIFRKNKHHNYFINAHGNVEYYIDRHTFNNNIQSKIKAQQLQLIYQGLIEIYDDVELNWKNEKQNKYLIYFDYQTNKIEFNYNSVIKLQGVICSSSKEILEKVIKEMGEDNIIFMLKNI